MTDRTRQWRWLGVLLLGPGCAEQTPPAEVTVTDSAGVRVTTLHADPGALAVWWLGEADLRISGSEPPLFGDVRAAAFLGAGGVVVADYQGNVVHAFDDAGALTRTYGGSGDGPGELRSVASVSVGAADSVLVFDNVHYRLSVFHASSGFVRSVDFSGVDPLPREMWALGDRLVGFGNQSTSTLPEDQGYPVRLPTTGVLAFFDGTGARIAPAIEFDGGYVSLIDLGDDVGSTGVPFAPYRFAAAGRDRIVFGSGEHFSISIRDGAGDRAEVRWTTVESAVEDAEIARVREALERFWSDYPAEIGDAVIESAFHDNVMPEARPAIGAAIVDPAGPIWVARFEPRAPGLPRTSSEWTVLSEAGLPVARLTLPAGGSLRAVREGRALLVTADALGIDHVSVHAVVGPGAS